MQATGGLGEPDGSNREQVGSSAETDGLFPTKNGRESVECLHPDRDIVLPGDVVVDPVRVYSSPVDCGYIMDISFALFFVLYWLSSHWMECRAAWLSATTYSLTTIFVYFKVVQGRKT
jgi:hypothetical protein